MNKELEDNFENITDIMKSDDNDKYADGTTFLNGKFSEYKTKRKLQELKLLRNQKQYDGVYEEEIKKSIPEGSCALFNPITTKKVNELKSRMYELVMPDGDRNFAIKTDNNPNLNKKTTNEILSGLNQRAKDSYSQYMEQVQAGQQPTEPPFTITENIIKDAIKKVALERAQNMEDTVIDQLIACNYPGIIAQVIFSAAIYGYGVVRGPYFINEKISKWAENEFGEWEEKTVNRDRPYIEFCKVWDFFPDLDAKDQDTMDGAFFYHTMTKQDLINLADRGDFLKDNILDYTKLNKKGNFKYEWYETALYATGNEQILYNNDKYRVVEYWGSIPVSKVKDIFDDLDEDQQLVEVNVWMIDGVVIKFVKNPFPSGRRPFRFYNFQPTDAQLLGKSLCDLIEELQRGLNAVHRAIHDNIRYIAGPIIELNEDLVLAGQKLDSIYPGKIVYRTGMGVEAQQPVLRAVQVNSHVSELIEMYNLYIQAIDDVTSIKAIMSGDMTGQATLGRSASGISQVMGAASIVLRDIAKQFDFFNQPLIESFLEWNMLFNDNENVKGDYQVYPRVSTAIVNKQLKAAYLNQMVLSMPPEQRPYIDWKSLLKQQLLINNVDPDEVLLTDDDFAKQQAQTMQAQQQAQTMQQQMANQQLQNDTVKANAEAALKQAKIADLGNKGELAKSKDQLDTIKALAEVNKNNRVADQKDNELKYKVLNDEMGRHDNFMNTLISQKNESDKLEQGKANE